MVRAEWSSLPPPRPKMPPIRDAIAMTSVGFQRSIGLPICVVLGRFQRRIDVGLRRRTR